MQIATELEKDITIPPIKYFGGNELRRSGVKPSDLTSGTMQCLPMGAEVSGNYVWVGLSSTSVTQGIALRTGRANSVFIASSDSDIAYQTLSHGIDLSSNFAPVTIFGGLYGCGADAGHVMIQPSNATIQRRHGSHRWTPNLSSGTTMLEELARRIEQLTEQAREDGTEVLASSRHDFIRFITEHAVTRRPSLSILDAGTMRAVWKNRHREQVAIHFKGGGEVNYVLFRIKDEGGVHRSYDRSSIKGIAEIISDNDLWRLLVDEG